MDWLPSPTGPWLDGVPVQVSRYIEEVFDQDGCFLRIKLDMNRIRLLKVTDSAVTLALRNVGFGLMNICWQFKCSHFVPLHVGGSTHTTYIAGHWCTHSQTQPLDGSQTEAESEGTYTVVLTDTTDNPLWGSIWNAAYTLLPISLVCRISQWGVHPCSLSTLLIRRALSTIPCRGWRQLCQEWLSR